MKKVFVNSLPKAGTNLVAKCLELLGLECRASIDASSLRRGRRSVLRRLTGDASGGYLVGIDSPVEFPGKPIDSMLSSLREGEFITAHVGYTANLLHRVIDCGCAPIVIMRDPRAVLNSFVHHVTNVERHRFHPFFIQLNEEERFLAALHGGRINGYFLQPMRVRCQALSPWLDDRRVLQVKFEDLVGSQGGGSDDLQRHAIVRLCEWIETPLDKVDDVAAELFGEGRWTFRSGQVASWKQDIPTVLQEVVTKELDEILLRWGYE